jgi:sulfur carrier protein ThiS
MSAQLKPLGILKSYVGGQTQVSVEANQTVREIMRALNIPSDLVALVMVNDQPQSKEYRAQDGDVITLIAVVGGG